MSTALPTAGAGTAVAVADTAAPSPQLDLVLLGEEHPERALIELARGTVPDARARLRQHLARGLIQAGSGRGEEAGRGAEALLAAEPAQAGDEARAAAALIRARRHENEGHNDLAATAADDAIERYERLCPAAEGPCHAVERWHARMAATHAAAARGAIDEAMQHARAARSLAEQASDRVRMVQAELAMSVQQARQGAVVDAERTLVAAQRRAGGEPALLARGHHYEALIAAYCRAIDRVRCARCMPGWRWPTRTRRPGRRDASHQPRRPRTAGRSS